MKFRVVIRMHSANTSRSFEIRTDFEVESDSNVMPEAEAIRKDLDSRFPGFGSVIAEVQKIVWSND